MDEAQENGQLEESAAKAEVPRRLVPFGLLAFIIVCIAMMVALVYYVWRLLAGL